MAKENQGSDERLAQTEPYPLVMDAPLSAFDEKRIDTVCDVLPKIAEQIIIFINPKDGKLAEDMSLIPKSALIRLLEIMQKKILKIWKSTTAMFVVALMSYMKN